MSKKRIITISRSFGSGGRMIGEALARRLEYHFYDRNLLDLLSEKTGISEQGLESADEKLPQKILDHYVPTRVTDYNTSHYLFRMESKLIEELAEKECCVFIGRLADWILKDRDDVLNVFITAPDEDRIQRIMETEDVTQTQAEKLMVQIDKMRNNYYSYFTDRKWQHTKDRDIIINSSLLGIDGTVGMLLDCGVDRHERAGAVVLGPVEFYSAGNPGTCETHESRFHHMVVVYEMALLDFVVGHLYATSQFGENHHLNIFVFQENGVVGMVGLFVGDFLDYGVGVDYAARTLIDALFKKNRILFGCSGLVGGNHHLLFPCFCHW